MKTTEEMDAAIFEAEMVRARHDGVHIIHTYLSVLKICRQMAGQGLWGDHMTMMFDETMAKVRIVARTGFAPNPNETRRATSRRSALAPSASLTLAG